MTKPLKEYLQTFIPDEHLWKVTLYHAWHSIIGNLKDKVHIAEINKNILFLGVIHSAWAHELSFLTPLLKEKINLALKKPHIQEIRFRVIKPKPSTFNKKLSPFSMRNTLQNDLCPSYTFLTSHEEELLTTLKDQELRNIMKDFLLRTKRRRCSS